MQQRRKQKFLRLVAFVGGCLLLSSCDGELGEKEEWSCLQIAEVSHRQRAQQVKKIVYYENGRCKAIGIKIQGGELVWLAPAARGDRKLKFLPTPARLVGGGESLSQQGLRIRADEYIAISKRFDLGPDMKIFLLNAIE